MAGCIALFNIARKAKRIHAVIALIDIFRSHQIATLKNAPVATPNHASGLRSRLGNVDRVWAALRDRLSRDRSGLSHRPNSDRLSSEI
jgi:hypothetical protein